MSASLYERSGQGHYWGWAGAAMLRNHRFSQFYVLFFKIPSLDTLGWDTRTLLNCQSPSVRIKKNQVAEQQKSSNQFLSFRLMDVYHRLTGDEGDFFLPFDLELSLQELSYICRYYILKRKEERSGREKEAIK